jgi:NAD(P)-dependent dehydrogenase (short-subunit alcohol dehydrogenase family)
MPDTLVWISGASSGIGAALAAHAPADRLLVDLSRSGSPHADDHLSADLADPGEWGVVADDFATRLATFTGTRAVFFHCAGVLAPIGFAAEVEPEAYRSNVLLNAAAPQALGAAFLSALSATGFAGQAELVLLTSGAATSVYEGWSSYGAGKAAVEQWVRNAGAEQQARATGWRVTAVAPGVVATPMQTTIRATDARDFPAVEKFQTLHAEGGLADSADVAQRMWGLLDSDTPSGAVVDLRKS